MFGRFKRGKSDKATKGDSAESENPYIANKEESDNEKKNLKVDKHNWQVVVRILCGLLALSMLANAYCMLQPKFIPYVVAVDELGHRIAVGPASEARPADIRRLSRAEVREWIENTRIVIGDKAGQKAFIRRAYARIGENTAAKKQLDAFYREPSVFERATQMSVTAKVKLTLPTSENTWQVEWDEEIRGLNGDILAVERWKAVITTEIRPQQSSEAIDVNPMGFFITSFNWSKVN